MRNLSFAILAMALTAAPALAGQPLARNSGKPAPSVRQLPLKGAGAGNPCAAYGAGFVRAEGTATCVKIGGAVSIGVGGRR